MSSNNTKMEEILSILKKDDSAFYGKQWTGVTPKDLATIFKKCFRLIPPSVFGVFKFAIDLRNSESYSMDGIKTICGAILTLPQIDVMFHANLSDDDYDEFILSLQETVLEWNLLNNKHIATMERKRASLEKLHLTSNKILS